MNLEDLVDLEARIAADESADPHALRARDHAAFARIESPSTDRHRLLSQWLRALEKPDEPSLGRRVTTGFRLLKLVLILLGLALGWSTAAFLLHYDGSEPINVATFLLVIVGVQIVLLLLLLAVAPLLRRFPNLPLFGDMQNLLRLVARGLEKLVDKADGRLSPERREAWQAARNRLRSRASLYQGVEQWLLLDATQVFAVAFNVAVLLCCLRLVVFSDLAFAWSTTLQADASSFHRLTSLLAAPFGWLVPDAVPSLPLVEETRFFRGDFDDGAAPSIDVEVAGAWWPFLIASTVTYGLLPRVVLLVGAKVMRARTLHALPLDTPDVDRIVRRLRAPVVDTRADDVAEFSPEQGDGSGATLADRSSDAAVAVVLWKDLPADEVAVREAVSRGIGAGVTAIHRAGGFDYESDQRAIASIAEADHRVVLLAEGFEAPDKSVRRFLAELRQEVGERRTLLVGLVTAEDGRLDPSRGDDVELWTNRLRVLNDPYLAVESMESS